MILHFYIFNLVKFFYYYVFRKRIIKLNYSFKERATENSLSIIISKQAPREDNKDGDGLPIRSESTEGSCRPSSLCSTRILAVGSMYARSWEKHGRGRLRRKSTGSWKLETRDFFNSSNSLLEMLNVI